MKKGWHDDRGGKEIDEIATSNEDMNILNLVGQRGRMFGTAWDIQGDVTGDAKPLHLQESVKKGVEPGTIGDEILNVPPPAEQ